MMRLDAGSQIDCKRELACVSDDDELISANVAWAHHREPLADTISKPYFGVFRTQHPVSLTVFAWLIRI
jgi:hypothetical protein